MKTIKEVIESPFADSEAILHKEVAPLEFRGEEFNVVYHYYECRETGENFTTKDVDRINVEQVHNQYRHQHNIPSTDKIRNIRLKYGLSASKMSQVLGFGINTYRNYEKGEVPLPSNARLIQMAENPEEFKKILKWSDVFEGEELKDKINYINSLLDKEENIKEKFLDIYLRIHQRPSSVNGFTSPNIEKFLNMISYFANKVQPFKTRLNKLLFYADFWHYKNTAHSISGLSYSAIQLGPVPNKFDMLYELANAEEYVEIHYHQFDDNIGEEFKPKMKKKFDPDLFNEFELETMDYVSNVFKNMNTDELIERSHKEEGWIRNKDDKALIDYSYAFDLLDLQEQNSN